MVLFCGAGISYPAGLPGFAGLVKKIYVDLKIAPDPVQEAAIKAKKFDTAIGLLESQIAGGREAVRNSLANILRPKLSLLLDTARAGPVTIEKYGRPGVVVLSNEEYERLLNRSGCKKAAKTWRDNESGGRRP